MQQIDVISDIKVYITNLIYIWVWSMLMYYVIGYRLRILYFLNIIGDRINVKITDNYPIINVNLRRIYV